MYESGYLYNLYRSFRMVKCERSHFIGYQHFLILQAQLFFTQEVLLGTA